MRKFRVAAVAAAIGAMTAMAASPKDFEVRLWPGGAPTANGLEDRPEAIRNGGARTGDVSDPTLRVFPAAKPGGKAVICCPGGGYSHLSMQNEGVSMAEWMNRQGVTFAVLKYRMPNGHKEVTLEDSQRAVKMMRDSAEAWGFSPDCVGIMGASAGGHFAATLATKATAPEYRPDFQILLYPVITMGENTHKGSAQNLLGSNPTAADIESYSLEKQVSPQTPRAFIALSSDDKAVPPVNALSYAQALINNGVPVSLHMYPTGGHGWGYRDSFAFKREWTGELEAWLRSF